MKKILVLLLLVLSCPMYANQQCHQKRVIYITFDGVAPVEITRKHFPFLFGTLAPLGDFIGIKPNNTTMQVASIPLSLPSYFSQMSGIINQCESNKCRQISYETLPEHLQRLHRISKKDLAVFSSWPTIASSAEHQIGRITINAGEPNGQNRQDKITYALAKQYLTQQQPRFLWLSLNDADEYAHEGNREAFINILSDFDNYLKEVAAMLKENPCFDNTWVVLTTDHGRGNGDDWTEHGQEYPVSKNTWMLVFHSQALRTGEKIYSPYPLNGQAYTTLTIKPLIERLMETQ